MIVDILLRQLYVSLKCGTNRQGIGVCLRDLFTQLNCCVGCFFGKKEKMKSLMNSWSIQFLPFSDTKPSLGPVKAKVQHNVEQKFNFNLGIYHRIFLTGVFMNMVFYVRSNFY